MGVTGANIGFGSGSDSSRQQSETFIDPSIEGFMKNLRSRAQAQSRRSGTSRINPLQELAFYNAQKISQGSGELADQASDVLSQNISRLSSPNTSADPFLQDSINSASRPVIDNFLEKILPSLSSDAALTGNSGSSRQGIAQGLASKELVQTLGDIGTNLSSNAFNTNQSNLANNLGLVPGAINSKFQTPLFQAGVGREQRGIKNEQLDDQFSRIERFGKILGEPQILSTRDSLGRGSKSNFSFGIGLG